MRGMFADVEGCRVLREYSVGFLWQFWRCRHALKLIPFARIRQLSMLVFSVTFELVNRLLFPLNYLPGSWLITICRRDD